MRNNQQAWIVAVILIGVFTLGFLAGISASRPLKQVFPKRSVAENPNPEEFIQNFQKQISADLTLTESQAKAVEEEVREMSQRIRSIQRNFIPQITKALLESIDKIMPLLDEEQKQQLQRRRDGIENSRPMRTIGLGTGGPGGRGGPPPRGRGGNPPWGDGPPPWGDGPPPWGDGPPPGGRNQPGEGSPNNSSQNRAPQK